MGNFKRGRKIQSKISFMLTMKQMELQVLIGLIRITKVKVNLSLCFNWTPRQEGVMGEWKYSSMNSLTSALDWGEWSTSRSGHFYPQGKRPRINTMTAISISDLLVFVIPVRLMQTVSWFQQNYKCLYLQSTLIVKTNLSCFLNANMIDWSIISVKKSRRMGWAVHIARMDETRNA